MRSFLLTGCLLASAAAAQSPDGATVVGRITDAANASPLAEATVSIEGRIVLVRAGADGRYRLERVPPGPQVLRVIRIGYAPVRKGVMVPSTGSLTVDVTMARSALNLPGIMVTADPVSRARGELGTASVIEGEAIRNQTAASLQGLLELLPGVVLQPPGLDGVQQFGLRSIPISAGGAGGPAGFQPGSGDLASFGTQIVLDGVPISNNANLQSLGARGELSFSTSAGGGIDLRRLPASTIERVEVIRGIPSSRFGDLTQGAILVDTRAGVIAPELLVRLDARTAEASVVGGTGFGRAQTGSATFDIARTKVAPGQTDDQSSRFALQLAHRVEGRLQLDTRIDAFKLVQDRPESPVFPGVESRSRDGGLRASERARLTLGTRSRIEWTAAYEAAQQRSSSRQPKLRGATPFTNRVTEGTQVGKFVGGIYDARVNVEGDPRHLYSRLEFIGEPRWLGREETFRAGLELRREWNAGPGYQFDIEFPPQTDFNGVNGFDRPRRFDLIPPMVTTGLYLDERISRPLGSGGSMSVQAGLRLDLLHEGRSWFSGVRDRSLQPRLNIELAPTRWFRFRAGAGRLAKAPALASLYPGLQYYDFINVNYYANDPAERLAVLTTRIVDKTNPALGYSIGDRIEAGFEAELAPGAQLAFVAFHDKVKGGVGVAVEATSFLREHFDIDPATIGTGRPPEYLVPASSTDTVPVLIDRPANNLAFTSKGTELVAIIPEIPGTRTRIALMGSYIETRVVNPGVELNRGFYDFQLGGQIPRVPYWDGITRSGNRLLLTTRLIHHQPQAGLVVTGTLQFTLKETRQDVGAADTLSFAGYLTREGQFVAVAPADRTASQYADLREARLGLFLDPQKGPVDWLFSLQVAKTLPAGGRLAFYAFNTFDRVGNFGDRFTTQRLFSPMRFGLEVTMPVPGWR